MAERRREFGFSTKSEAPDRVIDLVPLGRACVGCGVTRILLKADRAENRLGWIDEPIAENAEALEVSVATIGG